MAILHLIEFAVIVTGGRLAYVRLRPVRACRHCQERGCKRCRGQGVVFRLGARWAARADLAIRRAISEWRDS